MYPSLLVMSKESILKNIFYVTNMKMGSVFLCLAYTTL